MQTHGFSRADAISVTFARDNNQLEAETHFLASMDCFHVIGIITPIAAPLLLFTKYFRTGGGAPPAR